MDSKIPPQSVTVLMHGKPISQEGFDYSKYTPDSYSSRMRGKYQAPFNNCLHFTSRFIFQLRPPSTIQGHWEDLVIKKEFIKEYLAEGGLVSAAKWLRDVRVSLVIQISCHDVDISHSRLENALNIF